MEGQESFVGKEHHVPTKDSVPRKVAAQQEKDRRSRTGINGAPKKGGAGGKGTWGKGGVDDLVEAGVDPDDPAYDPEEERKNVVLSKVEFGVPFEGLIQEYFASGDVDELVKGLKDLNVPQQHSRFVKKALVMGIEKHPFEKELLSKCLSALYGNVLTMTDISDGFLMAMRSLPDIVLDSPDAPEVLGKFLARGIYDEIIPPAFLENTIADQGEDLERMPVTTEPVADPGVLSPLAKEAVTLASALVTESHRSSRLAHIWGPGDLESVKKLKEEAEQLLKEYLVSADVQEADRCVRNLNVPSFHFQLVKIAVRLALQRGEQDRRHMLALLAYFSKTGLVSRDHLAQGFKLCFESLSDIKCDVPTADKLLADFTQAAKAGGVLPADF